MRKLLAKWNPTRDVWEKEEADLLSEHLDVFSETWPISGSMRNGEAYKPPTSEPPIGECASLSLPGTGFVFSTPDTVPEAPNANSNRVKQPGSLGAQVKMLRTPCAAEVDGGALTPEQAKERGQTLRLAGQVVAEFGDLRTLPTPTTSDGNGVGLHGDGAADLRTTAAMLPTPKAADGEFGLPRTSGRPPEKSTHLATRLHYTDFGDYAGAVERWELVTGMPAPAPTEPSPKTGKQRLAATFVEWMMGLPAGWFTSPEMGLSRRQQFRIGGNGVVPQQAHAAVAVMLDTAFTKRETVE